MQPIFFCALCNKELRDSKWNCVKCFPFISIYSSMYEAGEIPLDFPEWYEEEEWCLEKLIWNQRQ